MEDRPVSEAFVVACQAATGDGKEPLKDRVADFTHGGWRVVINGTTEPVELPQTDSFMGGAVRPIECGIWWNGWLFGLLGPFDGCLAAGEAANEDTFIAAMKERLVAPGAPDA